MAHFPPQFDEIYPQKHTSRQVSGTAFAKPTCRYKSISIKACGIAPRMRCGSASVPSGGDGYGTHSWNWSRHVAYLKNIDGAVRMELHCFRHKVRSNPASSSKTLPLPQPRGSKRNWNNPEKPCRTLMKLRPTEGLVLLKGSQNVENISLFLR
jgi:hypothetical protein